MKLHSLWRIVKILIGLPVTVPLAIYREKRASTAVSAAILFVDMSASTWLKLADDRWIWTQNIYTLHARARKIIEKCKGNVAKTIGDCVMAYFTGERHEENAVACAGILLDSFESLYNYFEGIDSTLLQFQITVGVSSGEVFFLYRNDPYGTPVDLAAKIQGLANHGTAVFTAWTIQNIKHTDVYSQIRNHLTPEEIVPFKGVRDVPIIRMN